MTAGGCQVCHDAGLAALAAAVAGDDLDGAIERGLLTFEMPPGACDACAPRLAAILAARDVRLRALAARERHRAREMRLAERAEAKARRRAGAVPAQTVVAKAAPALPSAALAALARAKAKAAAKRSD